QPVGTSSGGARSRAPRPLPTGGAPAPRRTTSVPAEESISSYTIAWALGKRRWRPLHLLRGTAPPLTRLWNAALLGARRRQRRARAAGRLQERAVLVEGLF